MTKREALLIAMGVGAGVLLMGAAWQFSRNGLNFPSREQVVAAAGGSGAPKSASEPPAVGTEPGTTVELSPAEITAAGVQVAEVKTAVLKTDIDAFGRVEQPEAQLAAVSARIGGRVDKLYVNTPGSMYAAARPLPTCTAPKLPQPSKSFG